MNWEDFYGEQELRAVNTNVNHPFDSSANGVAIDLGEKCLFVFEDPSDGYRSAAASPLVCNGSLYSFGCDPNYIRVPCVVSPLTSEYGVGAEGLQFVDKRNGLVILRVGTDNSDDYYPSFICDYRPENIAKESI